MYRIVRREVFSDTTFLWEVAAADVARSAEPGHFVILRLREGAERIPLTVADLDRERGTVTMVVQALGKTSLRCEIVTAKGIPFWILSAPWALPQHVEQLGHVVLALPQGLLSELR